MSDTPKGNKQKMEALAQLRELCLDPDVAGFLALYMAAALSTRHLVELVEVAAAWRIAKSRLEPHRGPNGEWIDLQDRPPLGGQAPWTD